MIGGDQAGGSGDILNNNIWISRNILWHELSDESWIKIVDVPGLGADDDLDCLALIERRLGMERRGPNQNQQAE